MMLVLISRMFKCLTKFLAPIAAASFFCDGFEKKRWRKRYSGKRD